MIAVAIIAHLATVAVPQYQDYISRTRAAGALSEISGFRMAVSACIAINDSASVTGCNAGQNGIPSLPSTPTRNVVAWSTLRDGVIRVTTGATDSSGGANLTIIDSPSTTSGNMTAWANTGTSCHPTRGFSQAKGTVESFEAIE